MSDKFKISENIYVKSPEKGPIKFKIATILILFLSLTITYLELDFQMIF